MYTDAHKCVCMCVYCMDAWVCIVMRSCVCVCVCECVCVSVCVQDGLMGMYTDAHMFDEGLHSEKSSLW